MDMTIGYTNIFLNFFLQLDIQFTFTKFAVTFRQNFQYPCLSGTGSGVQLASKFIVLDTLNLNLFVTNQHLAFPGVVKGIQAKKQNKKFTGKCKTQRNISSKSRNKEVPYIVLKLYTL